MSRFPRLIFSIAALLVFTGASATVRADTVTVVGVDSGQFSTATVLCEFDSATNMFAFTVMNTSNTTQPGSTSTITGIGFDLPPTGNASASGLNGFTGMQAPSMTGANFTFSDGDVGNVPHGFNAVVLDFAFITGPSGNFSGGSVADGLAPGETVSFFVSGDAFAGFTEEQICSAIFVRFQNVPLEGGSEGSDVGVPGTPQGEIPEPSTILLLGSALVGLGGYARRRLNRN